MEILQEIGSYAGLAAVFGLAVLSALYFSQARDVKRLREWAARAPERASEQAAGGRVAPRTTAGAQTAVEPARATAGARAAAGGGSAAPPGSGPAAAAALARSATAQAAARQAGVRKNGPASNGPGGSLPRIPAERTPILAASAEAERRPSRVPAGRYLALIIAGVLIAGAGVAFAVTQLGGDDAAPPPARQAEAAQRTALSPADINVAVLNGTAVPGLARTEGDKVEEAGFQLGNVDNAIDKQRAESVVLFAPGRNREARIVSRELGISQIEPADQESLGRAPSATVIVVVGADRTQG